MRNLWKSNAFIIFVCMVFGALFTTSFSAVQEKSDEVLKKKYELILGEYEFDMSETGGGAFMLKYYIEDGNLWADSGDGRPAIMHPVEGKTLVFKAEDPEAGVFNISFEKDEEGAYTKNRVIMETAGIEVVGHKVK